MILLSSPGNEKINVQEYDISSGSIRNHVQNESKCKDSTDRKSTNVSSTVTSIDASTSTSLVNETPKKTSFDNVQTLVSMFPFTCKEYLMEQSQKFDGKPETLEKFISEHLAQGSQPPKDWETQREIGKYNDYNLNSLNRQFQKK